jgi:hypothetical protein
MGCNPQRWAAATSLLSEIFELHIEDWVLFPILIVEVPPLFGVNLEILLFHGLAQKSTASALLGRATGVVGKHKPILRKA